MVPASPQDNVAALRSRVEQQSTLIAMLKQRGDRTLSEVSYFLCYEITNEKYDLE